MTRHLITLPDFAIKRCIDWTINGPINNQFTSHGIEKRTVKERAADKMCEFAFAQWAGVDLDTIKYIVDDGDDVNARGILVDVKSCIMSHQLLCWPFNKIAAFDTKTFDRLVLVKHEVPVFEIVGWVTKKRFRRERIVATGEGMPKLTKDTRYMHQDDLDRMETFFDHLTDAERAGHPNGFVGYDSADRFVHYCHCGKDAGHGYDVKLPKNQFGVWHCAEHNPR